MRSLLLAVALLLEGSLLDGASELRLELARESLTGTHCRYRIWSDALPTDEWVTKPCPSSLSGTALLSLRPEGVEGLRRVDGRTIHRAIVSEDPLRPYLHDYDAETGELVRRVPFFLRAKAAWVFDPNPVVTLNDPTLQDRNDAAHAVPSSAYRLVELLDVAESGPLRGPHVTLVDRQPPNIAPPAASLPLLFDRSESGFEDVNAYFHIDRNQRYLQSLGYRGGRSIVPYSIEVDAHAASGADNSFFIPSSTVPGRGTLFFGEGGTDDAEDADLLIHEYGHAILEWISPGTFGGPFASQSRALGEGFSDYWAYSAHLEMRLASGRDPFCFADWDARCWENDPPDGCAYPPGSDCLRRLDSSRTMADYQGGDVSGVEYRNGSIWASALREIHQDMVATYGLPLGRRIADTTILESAFGAPSQPTFAVMARRLIEADRLLNGGAHAATICRAMTARGILEDCASSPSGEQTLFQSHDRGLAIPEIDPAGVTSALVIHDTRAIERLYVRVDIAHPSRGDLRIDLIAPDGSVFILQQVSLDRGTDVRTTFGLTASPVQSLEPLRGRSAAGIWRLVVRDLRAHDIGTLLSWGLLIQFAGDEPLTSRPRGESQMIPVVGNLYGVGATRFISDLRIANPGAAAQTATLIFTRSGADGLVDFAAVAVVVDAGQTVAFDNVVDSLFHTVGSGSLEVLGDVVVMSRTYTETERGTLGQQVPPRLDTIRAATPDDGLHPSLYLAALDIEGQRWNLGVTETGGGSGLVRVEDGTGGPRADSLDLPILPFSHIQIPLAWRSARIRVISGDAVVAAYFSQVDNVTGDAMFIPARGPYPYWSETHTRLPALAPALSASGADGTGWRTDIWLGFVDSMLLVPPWMHLRYWTGAATTGILFPGTVMIDVIGSPSGFARPGTAGAIEIASSHAAILHTRIVHAGTSQYVPPLEVTDDDEQHLLFIENDGNYRTNIGFVSDGVARVDVTVFDAAGTEIERLSLGTDGGAAQLPVTAPVSGGRAVVHVLEGRARAYASLIDRRSGDATFIEGQGDAR
jgi:subtilisin-like proprotein convertase family protein